MIRAKSLILGLGIAALTLGAGPCPSKVTGGGMLAGRATIAFKGDSCGNTTKGEFEYVAHEGVVKMHGELVELTQCFAIGTDESGNLITTCPQCQALRALLNPPPQPPGIADFQFLVSYRSTNPSFAGNGQALVCVSDNGEGSNASGSDAAFIQVLTGPFAGYTNFGAVQGNIAQHKCPKGISF